MPRPRLSASGLTLLIGVGIGLRLGHTLWASAPVAAPPQHHAPALASVTPAVDRRVIYRYRDRPEPPDLPADDACEQLQAEHLWCSAQLDRCEHQRDYRRSTWPSDSPSEEPGRWSELLELAFDSCEIELELELIDCSEYPCVAALRTDTSYDTPDELEQLSARVEAQLRACPVFARELGGGAPDELVSLYSYDVPCADGRREAVLGLTAAPRDSELAARVESEDWNQLMRWYYRRGEDIAATWSCD